MCQRLDLRKHQRVEFVCCRVCPCVLVKASLTTWPVRWGAGRQIARSSTVTLLDSVLGVFVLRTVLSVAEALIANVRVIPSPTATGAAASVTVTAVAQLCTVRIGTLLRWALRTEFLGLLQYQQRLLALLPALVRVEKYARSVCPLFVGAGGCSCLSSPLPHLPLVSSLLHLFAVPLAQAQEARHECRCVSGLLGRSSLQPRWEGT